MIRKFDDMPRQFVYDETYDEDVDVCREQRTRSYWRGLRRHLPLDVICGEGRARASRIRHEAFMLRRMAKMNGGIKRESLKTVSNIANRPEFVLTHVIVMCAWSGVNG